MNRMKTTPDYERPFFVFLTLILLLIYGVSISGNPRLQELPWLVLFTLLMALHIPLYWLSPWVLTRYGRLGPIIFIQGLIAFGLAVLSNNLGITVGLFPGLIGLSVGAYRSWRAVLPVFYILALAILAAMLILETTSISIWLSGIIPTSIFVIIYVSLYNRQTAAREEAQQLATELEAANRQLAEYAARVEDLTIANERQRMARELHDTLSQGLAGLILQLEAADAQLGRERPEKARLIVRQSMQQARQTLAEARRAISDLRENHSVELGDALRLEISRFESATGIPCAFHADSTPLIPDPVKEALIRAASEALTNIARHALASQASLSLAGSEGQLTLEITDNGQGFDPARVPSGHYGLLGIQERIRLLGGQLTIASAPGQGTHLLIQIPL